MREKRTLLYVFLLAMAPFFYLAFFSGELLLARDLLRVHLPAKFLIAQSLHSHAALPFWDSSLFSGMPFLADPNNGAFHPGNLLFWLFPLSRFHEAFLLFLGLNLALGGIGLTLLLRHMRISLSVTLAFVLAYIWSGPMLAAHSTPNILGAVAALPWYWYFLRKFRGKFSQSLCFSAAIAFPTIAGDPQFSYLLALFHILYGIYKRERSLYWWLSLPLAFLAAAAQILPTFSAFGSSSRQGGVGLEEAQWFSLHPLRLIEWFAPHFTGDYRPELTYWGNALVSGPFQQPFVFSLYLGSATAVFFFLSFGRGIRRRQGRALLGVVLFIVALALGEYLRPSLFGLLHAFLPGWKFFRYPERLIFVFSLLLVVIAAREAKIWLRVGRPWLWVAWPLPLFFIGFIFAKFLSTEIGRPVIEAMAHAALILVSLVLFSRYRRVSTWMFFAIVCFDMGSLLSKNLWSSPRNAIEPSIFAEKISSDLAKRKEEIGKGGAFRVSHALLQNQELSQNSDPVTHVAQNFFGSLQPNSHSLLGFSHSGGYGSLEPEDYTQFWSRNKDAHTSQMLRLLGVRYLPTIESAEPKVKALLEAEPYLYFSRQVIFEKTPERAEAAALAKGNENDLVLESEMISGAFAFFRVEEFQRENRVLKVRATRQGAGGKIAFRWNERWDKYWHVYVGASRLPLLRANRWAMGVVSDIPETQSEISLEYRYENPWVLWGIILSVGWLLLVLALVFRAVWRNNRGKC